MMEGFLEFALERYNYWIVIILMMTGLYTVFARGNLVKKIVGLNLFQTSVFIFYITIGKIAGGTAPIYMGADLKKLYEGAHGDGHGGDHGGGDAGAHGGAGAHGDAVEGHETALHAADVEAGHDSAVDPSIHSKIDNGAFSSNDLKSAVESLPPADAVDHRESLHTEFGEAGNKISNDALSAAKPADPAFDISGTEHGSENVGEHSAEHGADMAHGAAEILYSNPLPHVLILTAIVVGIATTAVGLALAVRTLHHGLS